MSKASFRGMYSALVTPMDQAGEIDFDTLRHLVEYQVESGLHGVYVGGSTAEAFLLDSQERMNVLETVVDAVKGRIQIIAHVGCISTRETVRLAKHARQAGAAAVSAVPPFYYSFHERELVKHYESIMNASDLPLLVYNNPGATGVNLPVAFFERMSRYEQVLGVKFTSLNLFEMEQIRARCGDDFLILNGNDQVYAGGALMAASDGAIGTSINLMPKLYAEMFRLAESHAWLELREPQRRINEVIVFLQKYGAIPCTNYILYLQGRQNTFKVREPLIQYQEEEQAAIAAFYEANSVLKEHAK